MQPTGGSRTTTKLVGSLVSEGHRETPPPPCGVKAVEQLGALKKHSWLLGNQRHPPVGENSGTLGGSEKALFAFWKSETPPPLWGKTVEQLGALKKKHSLLFGNQRHTPPPPVGENIRDLVCRVQTCLASSRQKTTLGEYN